MQVLASSQQLPNGVQGIQESLERDLAAVEKALSKVEGRAAGSVTNIVSKIRNDISALARQQQKLQVCPAEMFHCNQNSFVLVSVFIGLHSFVKASIFASHSGSYIVGLSQLSCQIEIRHTASNSMAGPYTITSLSPIVAPTTDPFNSIQTLCDPQGCGHCVCRSGLQTFRLAAFEICLSTCL